MPDFRGGGQGVARRGSEIAEANAAALGGGGEHSRIFRKSIAVAKMAWRSTVHSGPGRERALKP
jgi:hypothetical protein